MVKINFCKIITTLNLDPFKQGKDINFPLNQFHSEVDKHDVSLFHVNTFEVLECVLSESEENPGKAF